MSGLLRQTIENSLATQMVSLPSICSAHPDVLDASMRLAQSLGQPLIIEATRNQLNQDGGYTGMQARDFTRFVYDLAKISFAIHKVGPALTFAYRQAIYAPDRMLDLAQGNKRSAVKIPDLMKKLMLQNPAYWTSHYHGDADTLRLLRHYSYADRIRYYWTQGEVKQAVEAVIDEIEAADILPPLWMQFLGNETLTRASKLIDQGLGPARAHVLAEIQTALAPYFKVGKSDGR